MTPAQAQSAVSRVVKNLKLTNGIDAVELEQALRVLMPPPQIELLFQEPDRTSGQRQKILEALKKAGSQGVTNLQLNEICLRYGGRIHELRKQGWNIVSSNLGDGVWSFRLEEQ